jgi:hypothetical protein
MKSYVFCVGARGSVVVKALCCRKVAGSSPDEVDFLNRPNPSGRTGPGVDSASNRNEYQESSWA